MVVRSYFVHDLYYLIQVFLEDHLCNFLIILNVVIEESGVMINDVLKQAD